MANWTLSGAVNVFYDVRAGSASPLSETLQLATGGSQLLSDFMPVTNGKVTFADGQNSATIQVSPFYYFCNGWTHHIYIKIYQLTITELSITGHYI